MRYIIYNKNTGKITDWVSGPFDNLPNDSIDVGFMENVDEYFTHIIDGIPTVQSVN